MWCLPPSEKYPASFALTTTAPATNPAFSVAPNIPTSVSFPPDLLVTPTFFWLLLLLLLHISAQVVPTTLLPTPGRLFMVQLVRAGHYGAAKVTTSIAEPQPNDQNWAGKEVRMVVAHQGTGLLNSPSHWFSFFRVRGQWWRVDTGGRGTLRRQNPFQTQMGPRSRVGFTINFLVFM